MSVRSQRQTVIFIDRGERVEVELGAKRYEAYAKQAVSLGMPVDAVIRKDLKPVIGHLRRARREQARRER